MSELTPCTPRLAIALGVVVVMSGCAGPDADSVDAAPEQTSMSGECLSVESYSGRFVVGNPPPGQSPTLVPLPLNPGVEIPRVPVPTLSSVDLQTNPGSSIVTYTVRGDGMIGWTARFVQTALLRGTGETVPVAGACRLQLDLTGVDSNSADAVSERPTSVTAEGNDSLVSEVLTYRSSDSLLQSFVGIDDVQPTAMAEAVDGSAVLRLTISS